MTRLSPSAKIRSLNVSDWYDTFLSGWIRVGTHYYWAEVEDFEAEDGYSYVVYDMPPEVKAKFLYETYQFRHLVGRHWLMMEGKRCDYTLKPRESQKLFYAKYPPGKHGEEWWRPYVFRIGTTDLEYFYENPIC